MLCEFCGRRRLHDGPAHAARKADALAIDIRAGFSEKLQRFGEFLELDADFLEQRVGVVLDQLEAGLVEQLIIRNLAFDEGCIGSSRPLPGGALRAATAAPSVARRGPRVRVRCAHGNVARSARTKSSGSVCASFCPGAFTAATWNFSETTK